MEVFQGASAMKDVLRAAAAALVTLVAAGLPAGAQAGPLDTFDSFDAPRRAREGAGAPGGAKPAGPAPLRIVLQLGYDDGRFESGLFAVDPDGNLRSLPLNGGPGLAAGFNVALDPAGIVSLQATVGVEYAALSDQGATYSWRAWEADALAFAQSGPVRVGLGVNYILGARIEAEGSLSSGVVEFEGSPGFLAELDWVTPLPGSSRGAQLAVGLRYALQELRIAADGSKWDANALGFVLSLAL